MITKLFPRAFKLTFVFFFVITLLARSIYAREIRSSRVVILDPPVGEVKNFYLVSGEKVEIRGTVNGDVYALAGEVEITGTVNGDVLALARNVDVQGSISEDLRAVAEDIDISGSIGKNVSVISRGFSLWDPGVVKGGLVGFVQGTNLDSLIMGEVKLCGQNIRFNGPIDSNVETWSETVYLDNKTNIKGNLTYHSNTDAIVKKEASVSGQIVKDPLPQFQQEKSYSDKLNLPFKIIGFLGALIVGLLIIRFLPKFVNSVTSLISATPLKSGLIGFILLILLPIASIIFFITLVGIPLSILNILLYFVILYSSKIFMSVWIGRKLLPGKNHYWNLSAGLVVYYLLSMIPFLGGFLSFLLRVAGFGAIYLTLQRSLVKLPGK